MSDEKTIIADSLNATIFQPHKQRACLVQYSGSNLGKRYILDEPDMIAGRDRSVGIHINDPSVSRQHARIRQRDNIVEVEDMKTTNGTFVNERRTKGNTLMKDGDMLRLGTVLFKFFAHGNIENVFHDKIYRMATIDSTCQVFNKKYAFESLESEFKISRNYNRNLSVIYFDLDFFKKVNDTHGHNTGDFILKEVCALVKEAIRKHDIFGRVGGEEFLIILPDTDVKTAAELAERIRMKIDGNKFKTGGKQLKQTISMGVSQLKSSYKSHHELIESADKKLYKSKNGGRNKVTV